MRPYYEEPKHKIYYGHALDILRQMPNESVDMSITSPPYWGLRTYKSEPIIWGDNHCEHEWGEAQTVYRTAYKTSKRWQHVAVDSADTYEIYERSPGTFRHNVEQGSFCLKCHAWKGELGLEPTIDLYIEHLILIFTEIRRVLKKTGTCWVNLDDSYAGSGKGIGNQPDPKWQGARCDENKHKTVWGDYPAKSLCLIPQRFAIAMVNAGWILRNDIAWNKPNPMPESVKDRFTGSWEHLFFFVKNKRYFFEQQFDQYTEPLNRWGGPTLKRETEKTAEYKDMLRLSPTSGLRAGNLIRPHEELGRNKRDVWEIATEPYPEAHFATFPEKLCETPVLAGCPSMICKKCGNAREKIYEAQGGSIGHSWSDHQEDLYRGNRASNEAKGGNGYHRTEIGYTDCGCNAGFEPGVVLDTFCGSGKALAVAKKLGRKSIGIDLNPDYCKLAARALQKIPLPMELNV